MTNETLQAAAPRRRCVNCDHPIHEVEVRGELVLCHNVLNWLTCCAQAVEGSDRVSASRGEEAPG